MDRFAALLGAFSRHYQGTGLTVANLAESAGVHRNVLRPGYPKGRSPGLVRRVAVAAGVALREEGFPIDPELVAKWVEGQECAAVEDAIGRATGLHRCKGCGERFPAGEFMKPFGRCYPCYRLHAQAPASKGWQSQVQERIDGAPEPLRLAWLECVRAQEETGAAISYRGLAERAQLTEKELKQLWDAAGLPKRPAGRPRKADPLALLLWMGLTVAGTAHAAAPRLRPVEVPQNNRSVGVRRRHRRRGGPSDQLSLLGGFAPCGGAL